MPILVFSYIVLPAIQLLFLFPVNPVSGFAEALNFAASILAFHWIAANVALSVKIPLFQRLLPYDARIRFHILASAGVALFLAYHVVWKIAAGKYVDLIAWILLAAVAAFLSLSVLWIPVSPLAKARKRILAALRQGADLLYDKAKALHGWIVLALALLIFLHVSSSGLWILVHPLSYALYLAAFVLSFGLYLLSKTGIFYAGAAVAGVETHREIVTIRLLPDRPHAYKAGQFAFLRARASAGFEEHPFSYLSRPGDPTVDFAVRACGDFTAALKGIKPGDRVKIKGGFGAFYPGREAAMCFISSGIGTVPSIAILKELRASGDGRPLVFFLAVDYEDEIPDLPRVREIAASMPNLRLHVLVYSVDGLRFSEEYFRRELPDPTRYVHYVCSSPNVRMAVVKALAALGVERSAIRYEAFSLG